MSTVRGYSSRKQAHRDAQRNMRTSHLEPIQRVARAKPLSDEVALARLAREVATPEDVALWFLYAMHKENA